MSSRCGGFISRRLQTTSEGPSLPLDLASPFATSGLTNTKQLLVPRCQTHARLRTFSLLVLLFVLLLFVLLLFVALLLFVLPPLPSLLPPSFASMDFGLSFCLSFSSCPSCPLLSRSPACIHGLRAFFLFLLLVFLILPFSFSLSLPSITHLDFNLSWSPSEFPCFFLLPIKLATPARRLLDLVSRLAPTPPSSRREGGVGGNLASTSPSLAAGRGGQFASQINNFRKPK
jgi:hypothetical protein